MSSPSLEDLQADIRRLTAKIDALAHQGPLTADDLQARGYSQKEAYALLHRHGFQLPGARRKRISRTVLERIEKGES